MIRLKSHVLWTLAHKVAKCYNYKQNQKENLQEMIEVWKKNAAKVTAIYITSYIRNIFSEPKNITNEPEDKVSVKSNKPKVKEHSICCSCSSPIWIHRQIHSHQYIKSHTHTTHYARSSQAHLLIYLWPLHQ